MRYYRLKKSFKDLDKRKSVASSLLAIKDALKKHVPEKELNRNMLLATWNIRDFDSNKFGNGPRMAESYYYIAEIISGFDLVAVQEVNKDLRALRNLMYVLGDDWDFITTDVTEGPSGNGERMTFLYDKRRVSFENVAGEVVLPKRGRIKGDIQFARTPFLVSFQSGWSKFSLCTVHIFYGSNSGARLERRVDEIEAIAKFLEKKSNRDKETLIVLGDFNIVDKDHQTMKALSENGFTIPKNIQEIPKGSNMSRSKFYDQIGVCSQSEVFQLGTNKKSAGVFDFYDHVLREEDYENYKSEVLAIAKKQLRNRKADLKKEELKMKPGLDEVKIEKIKSSIAKKKESVVDATAFLTDEPALKEFYAKRWRTFQISDHLPMWVEIVTDHSDAYLKKMVD